MNKLLAIFIIGLLLISCKTDWITDYEKLTEKPKEDFNVVKEADTLEKDSNHRITVYSYESNGISKLEVNSNKYDLFNNHTEYYKNDSQIVIEKVIARNPIQYERPREEEEPIGEIIERVTYFKDRNYGIEKSRRVKFFLEDDIHDELNKRNEELKKLDFEIKEIGEKEFLQVQQTLSRKLCKL